MPFVAGGAAAVGALTGSRLAGSAALAVLAGLFEETSRALVYRRIEGDGTGAPQPAWSYLLLGLSRVLLILVHVGLALLVWRAVVERRPRLSPGARSPVEGLIRRARRSPRRAPARAGARARQGRAGAASSGEGAGRVRSGRTSC